MTKITYTVGHDAELFLYDKDNMAYPGIGIIGGDKTNPRPVDGGALQEDNVMAELNINPASTADEFINDTKSVMASLSTILAPHNLHFKMMPFQVFEPKFLKSHQAREFGCEPLNNMNIRTAGGHIHIGLSDANFHPSARTALVKGCDVYIGLPLATVETSDRKSFYGKAGSFRHKQYGIEYRTPSNIWLSNVDSMRWIFEQCRIIARGTISRLRNDDLTEQESIINDIGENRLQDIINHCYSDDAYDICDRFGINLPNGLL